MKIGELSDFSGVSRDTIRYYVSLGLLSPQRTNTQYRFTRGDLDDLMAIEKFKEWQFSLQEIETVMRIRRTATWVEPSALREFSLLLKKKRSELDAKIIQLQASRGMIDQELASLLARSETSAKLSTGVPLRALPMLRCPACGEELSLEGAGILGKYVRSGQLLCQCGYAAVIENGVIDTGNRYTGEHDHPDLERELYRTLCSDLLRMYQLCSGHIRRQLETAGLSGKVVLEANVNGYFFLYNHLSAMPKDCLYIIADKYPQTLAMYKELIEKLGLDLDILYIADAGVDWPLKKGCVDVCLDFFSSNEYEFYHENSFIRDAALYFSESAFVAGSYMDLPHEAKTRQHVRKKYPESSLHAYTFARLKRDLSEQGFAVSGAVAGSVFKTQDRFSFECHVDGEELNFYVFSGSRGTR